MDLFNEYPQLIIVGGTIFGVITGSIFGFFTSSYFFKKNLQKEQSYRALDTAYLKIKNILNQYDEEKSFLANNYLSMNKIINSYNEYDFFFSKKLSEKMLIMRESIEHFDFDNSEMDSEEFQKLFDEINNIIEKDIKKLKKGESVK